MFGFDWDDANSDHIAQHDVTRAEAEYALLDALALDDYTVDDERRFDEVGETAAGHILKIVTTERHGKIRVVTAYDAPLDEKRQFLRSRM